MQHDDGLMMVLAEICLFIVFYDFYLFFKVFINIHEYANKIICMSEHGVKDHCLSFNLVPSLAV